jgi:hypothetical protein
MPEERRPITAQEAPVQEAAAPEEKVVLPDTPEQRTKKRLEAAVKETDDQRSERRAKELSRHFDAHMENIKGIHAAHPAVFFTHGMPQLAGMSDDAVTDAMNAWNARRTQIDQANKAYHRAVRQTFAEHLAEDVHVRKVTAAKNAA